MGITLRVRHRFTEVIRDPARVVSRSCVMLPIAGPATTKRPDLARVVTVQKAWRASIHRLADVESPLTEPALTYCFNCMPCGYLASPLTYYCNKAYLCPFCFGRAAESVYCRVREVLAACRQLPTNDAHVAVLRRQYVHRAPTEPLRRYLAAAITNTRGKSRDLLEDLEPSGAYSLITLNPYQNGSWVVTSSVLAIVGPPSGDIRASVMAARDYEVLDWVHAPNAAATVRLVARAMRYPTGLLRVAPERVAEYLYARNGRRLSASYGDLRVLPVRLDPEPE